MNRAKKELYDEVPSVIFPWSPHQAALEVFESSWICLNSGYPGEVERIGVSYEELWCEDTAVGLWGRGATAIRRTQARS